MWYRSIILILLLICALSIQAQDQETTKDFEYWMSVKATKKFDFDLDISLEQQIRLVEYSQTFTEISLSYTGLNFINLGTEMRFKFLEGGQTEYRLGGYFGLEAEKDDFELEYRFKVQSNFAKMDPTKIALRNKINAKYKIKKDWRINTSFETFLPKEEGRFWLRKYRWTLGLRYKINKMHYVSLFYGIQRRGDLDLDDPIVLQHIIGTKYELRW